MHVVFISACEKRAIKRTRAVLDSYALRAGVRTWTSPMTSEGLQEVRGLLRRKATRQTAVACYRNDGRSRLTLLWVVGSRAAFGPDGHYPAGTMRRGKSPLPHWVRLASLLAQAGGLAHDIGKLNRHFADKLRRAVSHGKPEADPVRHEWISMRLLQLRREGDLDSAWAAVKWPNPIKAFRDAGRPWNLGLGLRSAEDALDFIVVTHHRLLGPVTDIGAPSWSAHMGQDLTQGTEPSGDLPDALFTALDKSVTRLKTKAGERSPEFWRGLALIARTALILADHTVSARRYPDATEPPYANTCKDDDRVRFNQPLSWHLEQVGRVAADMVYRLANLRLPALSLDAVEQVLAPADDRGRFAWQNAAVRTLESIRDSTTGPVLVFNIAATGSGKTVMNAKAACTLRRRPRFSIALNLRSLTLQTGDALRRDTGIGMDELATVVGDRTTAALHEWGRTAFDTDGPVVEFDAQGGDVELPAWMDIVTDRRPAWRQIIGVPVLVSTIDFLVNAGEPGTQGNHVAAVLRLCASDLVLDEIDSYDPKALIAVLRLIQMAALLGRHVICSSATLATPIAQAVRDAFGSGAAMHRALTMASSAAKLVILDDVTTPRVLDIGDDFNAAYRAHVDAMFAKPRKVFRKPVLQPISERSVPAWRNAVAEAVERLHRAQAWSADGKGKRVSFGLVRVANIRTAIPLARWLATRFPHARVACYHSQDFVIQRYLKERALDTLLSRKRGDAHIARHPSVRAALDASECDDVPFIVVATPVEEIGRDHDFDWAVIEPSSTQSIVQTAGRVNRHRLRAITEPNIAILQFNARWARGAASVFLRPGLESEGGEFRYASHDLGDLLRWDDLDTIDARLRFGDHLFSREDDRILTARLVEPMRILLADDDYPATWMTGGYYRRYPLRDTTVQRQWRLRRFDGRDVFEYYDTNEYPAIWKSREMPGEKEPPAMNDWLALDTTDLIDACENAGISVEDGLSFSTPCSDHVRWDRSFGFITAPPVG